MGVVVKQSVKGTVVTYLGALVGFVNTLFVSAYFLSPEEIGLIRILAEAAIVLAALSQLGIGNTGVKFFPYFRTQDGKNKNFFFYICLIPLLGLLLFGFLYFVLKQPIEAYFAKESPLFTKYYFWVFPICIFLTYTTVFETYSVVLMRIAFPKLMKEVGFRCLTILSILLYAFDIVNLNALVVIYTLSYGITALIDLIYVLRLSNTKINLNFSSIEPLPRDLKLEMSKFSLYCLFASLASIITMRIDIFMLGGKMGLEHTAIYSIAYYMAAVIEMPSRSTINITAPLISQAVKDRDMDLLSRLYKSVALNQFLVGCLVFIFIFINIKNLYSVMPNGSFYIQGIGVVIFISMAKLVESISFVGQNILNYSKYYRYLLPFVFLLGGLTIYTNLLFIPILGINGVALATFLTTVVYAILLIGFVWFKLKINPFSKSILYIVLLLILVVGIHILVPQIANPYIDSALRTAFLGGGSLLAFYYFGISKEFNALIDSGIKKILRRE